jgi:hypothetical protein
VEMMVVVDHVEIVAPIRLVKIIIVFVFQIVMVKSVVRMAAVVLVVNVLPQKPAQLTSLVVNAYLLVQPVIADQMVVVETVNVPAVKLVKMAFVFVFQIAMVKSVVRMAVVELAVSVLLQKPAQLTSLSVVVLPTARLIIVAIIIVAELVLAQLGKFVKIINVFVFQTAKVKSVVRMAAVVLVVNVPPQKYAQLTSLNAAVHQTAPTKSVVRMAVVELVVNVRPQKYAQLTSLNAAVLLVVQTVIVVMMVVAELVHALADTAIKIILVAQLYQPAIQTVFARSVKFA